MLLIGQRKIIILGSVRHNYIRSKLSPLTVRFTSTPSAIFLPLCAASSVPPFTRVSRWVFLLFFDLSHRWSSWSNSISVGCLFRGRPEQVFSHCHGQRVLWALSRNWILPHNINKCLFVFFAFLEERRLAPLGYHTLIHQLLRCHSPRAGTVQHNYITKQLWMRGCLKSYMQKK